MPIGLGAGNGGTLTVEQEPKFFGGLPHVFVLRVEKGRGAFRYLGGLIPGQSVRGVIPSLEELQPMSSFTHAVSQALAEKLTETGLYAKESLAMVNTWRNSYFESDGVRALCVLPQSWTDRFIPMWVVPQPRQIVRVMVGRLELLTKERETLAARAISDLSSRDEARREEAFAFLHEQGRYVEPIVRRVLRTTADEEIRTLCRRLLLTDFVTELRAAIHRPTDGARQHTDPLALRAQLARLLREIGLVAAARSEGEELLKLLNSQPLAPGQTALSDPDLLAMRAAAFEATGDDQKAATMYDRSIELQARKLSYGDQAPLDQLRGWWGGRAFARSLAQSGKTKTIVAELEAKLAQDGCGLFGCCPDYRYGHLALGFLLDAEGNSTAADSHWGFLAGQIKPITAGGVGKDVNASGS
jgi:hypothetical protein